MKEFELFELDNGDIYFSHTSCMYASEYEDLVNKYAGMKITKKIVDPFVGSFFGNIVTSFVVLKEHEEVFREKVGPHMIHKGNKNYFLEELNTANEI